MLSAICKAKNYSKGALFSTLQIGVLFFLQETNLSQGTYTPQGGIEENPGLFLVYRG
mgnify:CR=1 FL=1